MGFSNEPVRAEGSEELVILSAAKDHLERIERRKMILRFAQDDSLAHCRSK